MSVVDGIVSGLDTTSVINQLMSLERAPIARLEAKQKDLDRKLQAWNDIQRAAGTLRTASSGLAKEAAFLVSTVRSSNSELATATVRDGAAPGVASFRVHRLATAHAVMSGAGVTGSSAQTGSGRVAIGSGLQALGITAVAVDAAASARLADLRVASAGSDQVEVRLGDDTVTVARSSGTVTVGGLTLTVGAGGLLDGTGRVQVLAPEATTTVAGFASSVSVARAQVVNIGTSQTADTRLVLTSRSTGVAGSLLVGHTGLDTSFASAIGATTTLTAAQDARIEIGTGQYVERSTNAISDVFDGLTVQLASADPQTTVTVDVSRDTSAIVSKVKDWVNALNATLTAVDSRSGYDAASKTGGVLQGDSTARRLRDTVVRSMRSEASSGNGQNLAQLGITVDRFGRYSVDDTVLQAKLTADPAAVASVFARSGASTSSAVTFSSASEATQAGTYAVMITQAASQATALGSGFTTLGQDEQITISIGSLLASVQLRGGMSPTEAAAALNDAFAVRGLGLTADVAAGVLRVRSTAYGSSSRFSVTSDQAGAGTTGLGGAAADTPVEVAGSDVVGTIGGVAALGSGQMLTASTGAASGLRLRIDATTPGALGSITYTPGAGGGLLQALGAAGGVDGMLKGATDTLNSTRRSYDERIDALQRRLEATQTRLRRQFSQMESLLSQMRSQGDRLSSAISNGVYGS
jgi:flagellar hook-associated protein 2